MGVGQWMLSLPGPTLPPLSLNIFSKHAKEWTGEARGLVQAPVVTLEVRN